jgi:hypothetical protein
MTVELSIKELNIPEVMPKLRGFFDFDERIAPIADPSILSDCHFYDIHITHYIRDWPGAPQFRPPHPGVFEDFFPKVLGNLIGQEGLLTLSIKSYAPDYFNELDVVARLLAPKGLRYVLLSPRQQTADPREEVNIGNLVFEWPRIDLDHAVEHWFMTPTVRIEGYICQRLALDRIAALYFQPHTAERVRELLRAVEIGFRLWPDNNGLFLLTDKLDRQALNERLRVREINSLLTELDSRS